MILCWPCHYPLPPLPTCSIEKRTFMKFNVFNAYHPLTSSSQILLTQTIIFIVFWSMPPIAINRISSWCRTLFMQRSAFLHIHRKTSLNTLSSLWFPDRIIIQELFRNQNFHFLFSQRSDFSIPHPRSSPLSLSLFLLLSLWKGRRQSKSSKYTSPFPSFWYDSEDYYVGASASHAFSVSFCRYCHLGPLSHLLKPFLDKQLPHPRHLKASIPQQNQQRVIVTSCYQLPVEVLADNDPRKKKERNSLKRKKNKEKKKLQQQSPLTTAHK